MMRPPSTPRTDTTDCGHKAAVVAQNFYGAAVRQAQRCDRCGLRTCDRCAPQHRAEHVKMDTWRANTKGVPH